VKIPPNATMVMLRPLLPICMVVLIAACSRPAIPLLEDLNARENLSAYRIEQVRGTRDGDKLDAEATLGDGTSQLTLEMHFAIRTPTTILTSGTWQWNRDGVTRTGDLAERSVMFLGGQDGPPSVGGRFDLLDSSGLHAYRVNIPTTQLKVKLALPPR